MRKLTSFVLSLFMILGLAACGQKAEGTWQEQYDLGVRYLSEGNYEEAILAFTAAIEIDPKQAEAYLGRGDAYLAVDQYSAAEADYRSVIDLDADGAAGYDRLADVYVQTGRLEDALDVLRKGYEVTENAGLLSRLQALEGLEELPELPEELPSAAIVVSEYSATSGLVAHDVYQFDELGRMTSVAWYDEDKELVVRETWIYDDEKGSTTSIFGEYDDGEWVETTETLEGTENSGWYWYTMDGGDGSFITDPTLETENGVLEWEDGTAQYGYDAQGRAITIHSYDTGGALVGYCVITYTG